MATNAKYPEAQTALAERSYHGFDAEKVEIIKSQICPQGTSDSELQLFLMYFQRTGLDPFGRQIYLSERKSKDPRTGNWTTKRTPETTIDGFRLIADRTGLYTGQLGPFWADTDGVWHDVWLGDHPPMAAKVGILRRDFAEPMWGIALYREYVQTKSDGQPNSMWSKMPSGQLAKCAESLGLRKAFPRELSGMYAKEEMGQAENNAPEPEPHDQLAARRIAEEQVKKALPQPDPEPAPAPAPFVANVAPIPEEMQAIVADIKNPGGVARGLEILRKELLEAMPDTGGTVYTATLLKHNIKIGKPNPGSKVVAALLEMFEAAQEARAFKQDIVAQSAPVDGMEITDADLPGELFPKDVPYGD